MRDDIPTHILDWREGDEITDEHRRVIADELIQRFGGRDGRAAERYESIADAPPSLIADALAVMIATKKRMDEETFRRTFPVASKSDSLVMTAFLAASGWDGRAQAEGD